MDKVVTTDAASLTVVIPAGRLAFVVGPPGQVSLRRSATYEGSQAPTLAWQEAKGGLSLQSTCPSPGGNCGYDYTFAVPAAMGITASNTAGNISVNGLRGPAQLTAQAGNVMVAGLSGNLNVTDKAGNVTATRMSNGTADIAEGAGNVSVHFIAPPAHLSAQSSTGNITALVPSSTSYHVLITVGSGTKTSAIPDDPASQRMISLTVGTGNASLGHS